MFVKEKLIDLLPDNLSLTGSNLIDIKSLSFT